MGPDAEGVMKARNHSLAEEWIKVGGDHSDTEYNEKFSEHIGVEL